MDNKQLQKVIEKALIGSSIKVGIGYTILYGLAYFGARLYIDKWYEKVYSTTSDNSSQEE